MKDEEKTKDQLINELVELRRRFAEMEALEVRRKEAEDFIAVSKETILNSLMEHVIHQSAEMKILWANRSACESAGLAPEELVGRHCYEIWAQRTDPCPDCPVLKAMMTGQQQEVEKTTPDGRAWVINGYPIRDSNGDVVGGIELTLDVTERKLVEDALKKSEARYRHIVEDQTETICRSLPGGILTFVNDAYCRYFGKKREELIGRSFMSLIPEEDHVVVEKGLSLLTQENPVATSEHQVTLPDGEIGWQQWIDRAIFNNEGKLIEYQSVGRDITERKRMEEALQKSHLILEQCVKERTAELLMKNEQLMKEIEERGKVEEALRTSEERYRAVIDNIAIGVSLIGTDMKILALNNQMKQWYPDVDISTPPICYRTFNDPPGDSICPYCPTYLTLQDGEVRESITETPAGGEIRNYRIVSSPIKDKDGNITAAIEMVDDVTETLEIQKKLSASEKLYRTIFETTGTATVIINEDTTISLANREFEKLSGYSNKEVEGKKSWIEFVAEDELDKIKEYHRVRRLDPNAAPRNYEFTFIDRCGKVKNIFLTIAMITETTQSVASFLDITERKKVEDALRESENQLRFLSSQLLTVQEDERKRIAQELHDSIGQILTTVKFGVERAMNEVREVSAESIFVESLEHLVPVVQNGIEEVRTICADLWPSILDDFGILATISWFSREFQTIYPGIRIEKQINVQENEVPDFLKIVIYRILQEALNNVAKHSKADIVCVSLKKTEDIIEVFIKDNGKGFDVDIKDVLSRNGSKRRLGLVSMKERTGHSGGSFDIESSREVGTTVRASWRVEE